MDSLFDVAVDTPKYHRRGTLELKSEGEAISAKLKVSDLDPMDFAGRCEGKDFEFAGHAVLPGIGETDYQARGNVWGNSVSITCQTDAGKVEVFGTRLSSKAGSAESSHEYVMSASTGNVMDHDDAMYSGLYADGG